MNDLDKTDNIEEVDLEEEIKEVEVEEISTSKKKFKEKASNMCIVDYLELKGTFSTLFYNAYKNLHKGKLLKEADWDKIIK